MVVRLHYLPGSPFARMLRVLIREHGLAVEEVAIDDFPPPVAHFALNPLGQVPVYVRDGNAYFPTVVALEAMFEDIARQPTVAGLSQLLFRNQCRLDDLQLMHVILAMGEQITTVCYIDWTGLGQMRPTRVGYHMAERAMERVGQTLDWLEVRQTGNGGFRDDGLSPQDIALACLLLWSDARKSFDWRQRTNIARLVDGLATRDSFTATAPQPWSA